MQIYLAGHGGGAEQLCVEEANVPPYLMASYYYMRPDAPDGADDEMWKLKLAHHEDCNDLLVDSGAFTFLTNDEARKGGVDWEAYLDGYIEFINRHDIEWFVEMDLDSVVGLSRVRELRDRLERGTGKDCIPAWHPSRGKEAFIRLCENYEFIAIGGIYDEISPKWFKYFPWFIKKAHEYDTRIHGLGFTATKSIKKYPFDSVDSRSWMSGCFSAKSTIYEFTGDGMETHSNERRRKHYLKINRHNLKEWIQYVRWADRKHEAVPLSEVRARRDGRPVDDPPGEVA